MLPAFLLPDTVSRQNGVGPEVTLGRSGKVVLLTLEITRILEQETLELSLWGSPDGVNWRELNAFPPKSYCGKYSLSVSLGAHPDVTHLRVQWKMSRWSGRSEDPLFGFHVIAEEAKASHRAGSA